jgi:hypothetical protein
MNAGAMITSPDGALDRTDRILRRLLRQIKDAELATDEEFGLEVRRAKRQLRANKLVLDAIRDGAAG